MVMEFPVMYSIEAWYICRKNWYG